MFRKEIEGLRNLERKYKDILNQLSSIEARFKVELASVDLSFQKEFDEIERIKKEKQKYEKSLVSIESEKKNSIENIGEKEAKQIAKKIIKEVYDVCAEAYNFIVDLEKENYGEEDSYVEQKFNEIKPNYDKGDPFNELRANYRSLEAICSKITNIYTVSEDKKIIQSIAQAYKNVSDIYARADEYTNRIFDANRVVDEINKKYTSKKADVNKKIDEQSGQLKKLESENKNKIDKKEQEIKQRFEKEKGKLNSELASLRRQANTAFKNLKDEIDFVELQNEELPFMQESPIFNSDLSNATWYLGMMSRGEKVEKFDALGEKIELPNKIPFGIDLSKPANVIISYEPKSGRDSELMDIVKCLSMNFLISYPDKYKRIAAVHNESISDLNDVINCVKECCDGNELVFHSNEVNSFTMATTIREIVNEINRRRKEKSTYKNIFEYNKENSDNVYPLILFFAKDVDFNHGSDVSDIRNITTYGNDVGVYTVLLSNKDKLATCKEVYERDNYEFSKNFAYNFFYEKGKLTGEGGQLDSLVNLHVFNRNYYKEINSMLKAGPRSMGFLDFHKEVEGQFTKSKSAKIIPIGKHGSSLVTMELRSDSPFAHSIIEGKSGSGKTAFMHSILLSVAYHYSPEEMEIILLDFMANGRGFEPYKKLKHVKYMSMDASSADVLDLMDFISAKYNDVSSTPRAIIAIDEYTSIPREAEAKLIKWARQMRKYGVCLLMSSQEAIFDEVNSEVGHKFELYKDSRYKLISDVERYGELTPMGRLVVYKGQNDPISMRFAYAGGSDGIAKIIELINDKYANSKFDETIILGRTKALTLNDAEDAEIKLSGDKWAVRIPLGEDAITGERRLYKVDRTNRRIFIFGDQERASTVEYLFAKAFKSFEEKEPTVYYLNFATSKENTVLNNFGDMPTFSKKPLDCVNILKKAYAVYKERFDKINNGEDVGEPVEIIIHGAQRMDSVFEMSKKSATAKPSSSMNLDDIDNPELLMSMLSSTDESSDVVDDFENLSFSDMFDAIFNADEALKINIVMHFDSASDMENDRKFYTSMDKNKDFIIVPSIPEEREEVSYASIIADLSVLKMNEYKEKYSERIVSNMSEQALDAELNNLKKLILIDEKHPHEYVPYED